MKESEVGKFLRLLGHDLQNQLGAIDLNLQIVPTIVDENDPAIKSVAAFLDRATLACKDMIDTLGDVQSFARAVSKEDDGDDIDFSITKVDLSAKVRDLALTIQSTANARSVTVSTTPGDSILALAETDSVRRSIRILANEALRSSFPGATLEIRVSSQPVPMVEIKTSQEGIFEDSRPMLSIYLVRELLEASNVTLLFSGYAIQLLFQPA